VYERSRGLDWSKYDGMVLLNHGIFTWGDTAKASYDAMIRLVSAAEDRIAKRGSAVAVSSSTQQPVDPIAMACVRRAASSLAGRPMIAMLDSSPSARGFSDREDAPSIATRGPLTPDHIIRTKRIPVLLGDDPESAMRAFADAYREYFARNDDGTKMMLDVAPRWAVWPGRGIVTFGRTARDARIVADIVSHTTAAIQWSESLGGWRALPEKDLFDVEYWELEQAKLAKGGAGRPFDGKVAVVTGAASGIGRAVASELAAQGAAVVTADISPMSSPIAGTSVHIVCDLTDDSAPQAIAARAAREFGGLDVVVSNVGMFPASTRIDALDDDSWRRTFDLNVTSHQRMLTAAVPLLRHGVDPAVVVVGSKNVPAPGPGQAAYSASKAALTQLARVAALELAADGIRVNVVHPNAVFDTGIWTDDVLKARAAAYGKSVDEYKRSNLLGVEVTSRTVAAAIVALASPAFSATTGAQVPIDGGNERVI
jgi:NAD(P)-dependent dehydrogenase (short-subunit alcohol dehydrogenase family)/ribulose-5-phosphate 4-epimerase/fuculose-1-phosphate aldolase